MSNNCPAVSVVIPVFNVEDYIERCLHTLFNQTLQDIEFIFIDDGSEDNSISILKDVLNSYPEGKNRVKILTHTKNRGVAAARTTGILSATGEYIIHCDPDDYVDVTMYETLYKRAKEGNLDFVACDYYIQTESSRRELKTMYGTSHKDLLKKNKADLLNCPILWNKLVKRKLILDNHILPYEGYNYGEDLFCVVQILYYSKTFGKVDKPLYTYCERESSITRSKISKELSRQYIGNIMLISDFLRKYSLTDTAKYIEIKTKVNTKLLLIPFEEWFVLFKDSNHHLLKLKEWPWKSRIVWWLALQNKFFYNLIFRLVPTFRFNNLNEN